MHQAAATVVLAAVVLALNACASDEAAVRNTTQSPDNDLRKALVEQHYQRAQRDRELIEQNAQRRAFQLKSTRSCSTNSAGQQVCTGGN